AFRGGLKLSAESLDVTPYYDLFAAKSKTGAPKAATTAPAPSKPAAPAGQEPPAQTLPFGNFPIEVNIGRFYLRELEITNWVTALKLDGGQISISPLQLSVNGAPIKGALNLNLGVPGYEYDVSLSGDKIPLEPIANTFMPDKRGMYKGDLAINSQVKGAETTGTNLQNTLTGQLGFTLTNANIQIVVSPKLKQFLSPVPTMLGIPEMMDSPLNWVDAHTEMGGGRINFKDLQLVSPMLRLETRGVMPIADVLTNSPFQNWPVDLSLSRPLAERARLVSSATGQTDPYVKLPGFLRV